MTRVGIVGPGRAGTAVALAVARSGWRIAAVAGGRDAARHALSSKIAGVRHVDVADLPTFADTIVIAVPDRVVGEVADTLAISGNLTDKHRVVHLSGVQGCGPLRRVGLAGARIAACHPAMTLPDDADPDALVGTAWAVTVPAGADPGWAVEFVEITGGQPFVVTEGARVRYHAALAIGSNAVGAAVATARQLLLSAGFDRPEIVLEPLITASVTNVLRDGAAALTGPVMRGDTATVAAHLDDLDRDLPAVADI